MAERDPRKEPRSGDVLKLRRGQMLVQITTVDCRGVGYQQLAGGTWAAIAKLDYWVSSLAKSATIISRGKDDDR